VQRAATVPDPRQFRLRYFLLIVLAAILSAAVLRHVLHVYGGWSREDIRGIALIAALVIGIAAIVLRKAIYRR
jgi:hypothetical protein